MYIFSVLNQISHFGERINYTAFYRYKNIIKNMIKTLLCNFKLTKNFITYRIFMPRCETKKFTKIYLGNGILELFSDVFLLKIGSDVL